MSIIEKIITWALALIIKFGYGGIFLTMSLESAAIPIPSEVVLPFSGFLSFSAQLNFWWVVIIATLANITGAIITYYIGLGGGRPLLERYGRYILIHQDDIEKVENWLGRYGGRTALLVRVLPGVRTFSSLVLGAGRLKFNKFFWYTLLGSFLWNLALAYVGFVAGKNWDFLQPYFRRFEMAILVLAVVIIAILIYKHIKRK